MKVLYLAFGAILSMLPPGIAAAAEPAPVEELSAGLCASEYPSDSILLDAFSKPS